MRLDTRQFRFVVPFVAFPPRQTVRLGGKRGSIHVQETALVVEGELLCFTLIIGIEWIFRRALSEWTTVTIPYSRIQSVSVSKLWPLRMFTLLFLSAWIALMVWFWGHEAIAPIMTVGFALLLLMIYINVRVKRAVRVAFRGKGRRKLLAFVIRSRPLRRTFIETLERHVSAAQQFHMETSNVGSI